MAQSRSPALVFAAALAVLACACGSEPRRQPPEFVDGAGCAPASSRFAGLTVAGSGSALPAAQAVADAFRGRGHGAVWIPPSIGTRGAVQAVRDGAVDVGLVTRPLVASEAGPDLVVVPWLESRVVLAGQPNLGVESLDLETIEAMYAGAVTTWSDGTRVVPLARESGDSGELIISQRRAALFRAIRDAVHQKGALELHTDLEMKDALLAIRGSLGTVDYGAVRLGSLPLAVSKASVQAQWWRPYYLLHRADAGEPVRSFVEFATSEGGVSAVRGAGYRAASGEATP